LPVALGSLIIALSADVPISPFCLQLKFGAREKKVNPVRRRGRRRSIRKYGSFEQRTIIREGVLRKLSSEK
jgi:hypothetical protein